ncbi:MAG TPA: LTA synthase family protein [Dokdonella sp.]|uniref:LTA synthase family protein n=1 Tax=Dokdonella sp. TaxID=2291710 RepID=UPI002D7E9F48|nr:LTA synthase family protein [Dokdonella sp.]HET9033270.1 LTA synthase family protein [Dokdonella sp.]
MSPDSKLRSRANLITLSLDLTLFLALALTLSWLLVRNLDPAFAELAAGTQETVKFPWPVLLNAAPAVLLAVLLLALTRRGLFSIGLSMAFLYLLYFANAIKIELLDTPVLPGDFSLLGHMGGGSGAELLAHYLPSDQMAWFGGALLALMVLGIFDRAWIYLRGLPRLALLLVALAGGAGMIFNLQPVSSIYARNSGEFLAWSPLVSAKKNGLPVTLLNYLWRMRVASLPINQTAADILISAKPLPQAVPPADELPDIIILQSESFFDPARLRKIGPHHLLPHLRKLQAQYRHGDLWVPTYGGGTIRTEFEVLTGLAMREFPTVQYPYFRLANKEVVPGIARTLAARGYQTLAIHPNTRDFWNRGATFERMGFDHFDADEQFAGAERVGWYTSDAALTDHMINRLNEASGPLFMFAVSIENHGPYAKFPGADPERLAAQFIPEGLDEVATAQLRGYFYHLQNADQSLGRLVETLQQRKRRALLLFYGDHLPAMPQVYSELGFDDGAPGPSQPVPWLLVDTAKPPSASANESTASFYLPALLLDAAGIDDHGYFTLLDELRRDDRPGRDWTPANGEGMRAIMRLRQLDQLSIGTQSSLQQR